VKKHLPSTPLLDFALAVEQVTTKKKAPELPESTLDHSTMEKSRRTIR
jgi:hypothetical protein